MRKFLVAIFVIAVALVRPAFADDVTLTHTFSGVGSGVTWSVVHDDQDVGYGYKGWATIILFNDTNECWSDLHLSLYAVQQPFGAIFIDGGAYNPTYQLGSDYKPLTWTINNAAAGGPTMDLVYSDFVNPGQTATFKVYTNNMATKTRFGLSVYPTSDYVPEPSSMLAIFSALVGLSGLVVRRRR